MSLLPDANNGDSFMEVMNIRLDLTTSNQKKYIKSTGSVVSYRF
jgi:hypothetical protein